MRIYGYLRAATKEQNASRASNTLLDLVHIRTKVIVNAVEAQLSREEEATT